MLGGYGELVFQFGMVDENEREYINQQCETAIHYIRKKDFYSAFEVHSSTNAHYSGQ